MLQNYFIINLLSICHLLLTRLKSPVSDFTNEYRRISFPEYATPVSSRYAPSFRTFRTIIVIAHRGTLERNRFRVSIAHDDDDVSNRLRDRRGACSTSIRSAAQPTVSDCGDSSLSLSMTLALGEDASGGADAHPGPVARLSVGA